MWDNNLLKQVAIPRRKKRGDIMKFSEVKAAGLRYEKIAYQVSGEGCELWRNLSCDDEGFPFKEKYFFVFPDIVPDVEDVLYFFFDEREQLLLHLKEILKQARVDNRNDVERLARTLDFAARHTKALL